MLLPLRQIQHPVQTPFLTAISKDCRLCVQSPKMDVFGILHLRSRFKCLARTDVAFNLPLFGWAVAMSGHIPVIRHDRKSAQEAVSLSKAYLEKGISLFFFAEGKLSQDGKLLKFKKGAFRISKESRVPIIPITFVDSGKIIPASKELNFKLGRSVTIIVHEPIYPTESDTDETLLKKTRERIAASLPPKGGSASFSS
mmetsp:Transcript_23294/g.38335  ORF Transcript_23294/g.38335 Transcript_23294/m.38335 type:complete len:198 (+) Transcript_23294:775-1368(+)